ncbi:methyl-accepting chemotaxis protein [Baaleninema sp.]|uniref:methyl-accepting chemotaxis protein n=1 Tax=Baaleninema sp. TaxID=3101197 RepID=UPI003D0594ED
MKSQQKSKGLRVKAAAIAVAIGTIPVLIVGGLSYFTTNQNLRQKVLQTQNEQTRQIAERLEDFMLERYGDIWAISNLPTFSDNRVSEILDKPAKESLLNTAVNAYQIYDSLAVFDANGSVLLKSDGQVSTQHIDRPYFQAALQSNRPVISQPEISPATGELSLYITAPLRENTTGQFQGLLRARLPVSQLIDLVEIPEKTDRKHVHIVDSSGQSFININSQAPGKDVFQTFPLVQEAYDSEQVQFGVVDNLEGNRQRVMSVVPLRDSDRTTALNWSVIIDTDPDLAFAASNQLLQTIGFGTLATLVSVAVIAVVVSLFITEPMIQRITSVVQTIVSASSQMAATVEQQERTLNQQAASVNESTTTADELNASSQRSAERAEAAERQAQQVLRLAEDGTLSVEQTLAGMQDLQNKVETIAGQISQLSEFTRQIGTISTLVSDLANQTNMLALNASVEAVRAGEYGKGFAVVASEIRKLADQSRSSAQKIDNLVSTIQSAIDTTVMATEDGTKTVANTMTVANTTADKFIGVKEAIREIVVGFQQIAATANQQARAIEQLVEAMNALDRGVSETASGISQTRLGSQDLNQAALTLQSMI